MILPRRAPRGKCGRELVRDTDPIGLRRSADGATLYLMVGLPGSGKTTRARTIASACDALCLTPDEWILALYGNDLGRMERDAVRDPIEALQWQVAERALALGCSVILDWGLWSRAERAAYRKEAEALGATVRVIYLDAPIDELWSRIAGRAESAAGTLQITRSDLEEWATWFEPPGEEELL